MMETEEVSETLLLIKRWRGWSPEKILEHLLIVKSTNLSTPKYSVIIKIKLFRDLCNLDACSFPETLFSEPAANNFFVHNTGEAKCDHDYYYNNRRDTEIVLHYYEQRNYLPLLQKTVSLESYMPVHDTKLWKVK